MTGTLDLFIGDLRWHLEVFDAELAVINTKIAGSLDPESDGFCDRGEYIIGAGFVAVQKYMAETFRMLKISQGVALSQGPKLGNGETFANVIWSAGNYWKHQDEWWENAFEYNAQTLDESYGKKQKTSKQAKNAEILDEFGVFGKDYICANVLAVISEDKEFLFQTLLPKLQLWRTDLTRNLDTLQK